ncbi:hypothetical protein ACIHEI_21200 [Kitasatospora sp. NPDC051984]|uniref:hypothetical protein n=1 Tax=Kitasatospora sp. NPDC051984 TaxID=3364059 RepID=UPI0037C767A4
MPSLHQAWRIARKAKRHTCVGEGCPANGHQLAQQAAQAAADAASRTAQREDAKSKLSTTFGLLDLIMLHLTTTGYHSESAALASATIQLARGYSGDTRPSRSLAANAVDKAAHALFKADRPIEEQIDCGNVRVRLWLEYGPAPRATMASWELEQLLAWQHGASKPTRIGWT